MPAEAPAPRPARLADAPEHWLRLVAEHAPGLLAADDETEPTQAVAVPSEHVPTALADTDRNSPSISTPTSGDRTPAHAIVEGDTPAPHDEPERPLLPSPRTAETSRARTRRSGRLIGTGEQRQTSAPVDERPSALHSAETPTRSAPPTVGSRRAPLVAVRPSAEATASAQPSVRAAEHSDGPGWERLVSGFERRADDVWRPAVDDDASESRFPVAAMTTRPPAMSTPRVETASDVPALGGVAVPQIDLAAPDASATRTVTPGWPGIPSGGSAPGPGPGSDELPHRRRTRELLSAWRDELDEAQEELGWTASCSS
jgi:hypothetical protein